MVKYLFCIFLFINCFVNAEEQAASLYKKAVNANTIGEREENFEKALKKYISMYNKNRDSGKRNGYLSFNIANCYLNLGQFGKAILYYKEANKLLPENEKISSELKRVLSKRINAIDAREDSIISKLLFFHYSLSNPFKLNIVLFSSFLMFVLLLLQFKIKFKTIKLLLSCTFILYIVFFVSILIKNIEQSNIGVIMKVCNIHIDAGENYALINKKPINIGSTIKVINFKSGWYQVQMNNGQSGYIFKDDLQLVL